MYAIIKTGGKQYRVQPGDVLRVEKMECELGSELELTDVLMVGGDQTLIGSPMVKDAKVTVVVTNLQRGPKVIFFKKKRRQGYRRTGGHRQWYTELFVKSITTPDGKSTSSDKKAQVYNPEKKLARLEAIETAKANRKSQPKVKTEGAAPAKKKAAKKVAAPKKKVAKKKTATKSKAKAKTTKKAKK